MAESAHKPVRLFFSYSHKDERYLDRLKTHLVGLSRQGLIEEWHDRKLVAGQEWDKAIDENLQASEIILLLVTPDFMRSEYVSEKEIKKAIEKHERGEARVIPIIVRPADWQWAPFGQLQALPKDAKPITRWSDRDEAWLDVIRGIRKAVEELTGESSEREAREEHQEVPRSAVEDREPEEPPSREREREIEGPTDRAEPASLHQYREEVQAAWVDGELHGREAERLRDLANELGLSANTAADIEREVMGDTLGAVLKRQEAVREEERNKRLEELYTQARRLHRDRRWQAVIDLFEQIHAEDPAYPDPKGILASARDTLEAQERTQRVAALYDRGQRHMTAQEWPQALECFEEVQRLEPNYRETETLLAQARQQESADHAKKVEASERQRQQTTGRSTDQAERVQPERSAVTRPQVPFPMLARNWWALALGGLIMVILGLFVSLTLSSSSDTGQPATEVFIRLLSSSLIIAIGVSSIVASSTASPRLLLRAQGVISSVAGVVVLLGGAWGEWPWPVYYYTFDFWAICLGVIQIIAAIRLGWEFKVMPLMLVSGALLVVYGVYGTYITSVCIERGYSGSGACESPTLWLLGILLLASGASLVAFAFRVRHGEKAR